MTLNFNLAPRRVAVILGAVAIYFAVQSVFFEFVMTTISSRDSNRSLLLIIDLFSVNTEESIPTWYASILIFFAATLLAVIAVSRRLEQHRDRGYWVGLAIIFLYLSIDEGSVIHEIVADALRDSLELSGFLTFGWQIVAAPLLLIFALAYFRFLVRLQPRTRNLFIAAGIIYVGGAFVIEGISANQWFVDGGASFTYLVIASVEEMCEMLGITLFIFALLDYMVAHDYRIGFSAPVQPQATPTKGTRRILIAAGIVILVLNAGVLLWASQQPRGAFLTVGTTEEILDLVLTDDVQVTRFAGRFSLDNLPALQTAAALLTIYDQVLIVTTDDGSFALAADTLPFDRDALADTLTTNGIGEFVIFDAEAIRMLVGAL